MITVSDFPKYRGKMEYVCLGCQARFDIHELYYTCPHCGGVFVLEDTTFDSLLEFPPSYWQGLFDKRSATRVTALRGVLRFYELMAPVVEEQDIVYLGEGHTPLVAANDALTELVGAPFFYKNDGQNPSASFKDRGMACAFSYLKHLVRVNDWDSVLTVCASTGDTSASAALYAAYVGGPIKSVVILPKGKVTPQQLAQPLGSGATVIEVPGVFDDCMKVVEHLADNYRVALLNSKNAWRILGQESYAFEIAQWFGWDTYRKCVFVPIGNAGNVTAIMSGFLKLKKTWRSSASAGTRIFRLQSHHGRTRSYNYFTSEARSLEKARVYHPVFRELRAVAAGGPSIGNAGLVPAALRPFSGVGRIPKKIGGRGGRLRGRSSRFRPTAAAPWHRKACWDGQTRPHGHNQLHPGRRMPGPAFSMGPPARLGLGRALGSTSIPGCPHRPPFSSFIVGLSRKLYFRNTFPPIRIHARSEVRQNRAPGVSWDRGADKGGAFTRDYNGPRPPPPLSRNGLVEAVRKRDEGGGQVDASGAGEDAGPSWTTQKGRDGDTGLVRYPFIMAHTHRASVAGM